MLRRETGLLEVTSSEGSGYIYLKNGKVKDAQIGKSKGVAAVNVVRKFNDASFRFKQLEAAEYARVVWQRRFGPTRPVVTELPIAAPALPSKHGGFTIDPAAMSQFVTVLESATRRTLRDVRLYSSTAYDSLQNINSFLRRQFVACAAAGSAFWRRAELETRMRRIVEKALAAQESRRRARELRLSYPQPAYPRKVRFQWPTIPTAAITSALHQGLEHNVIFALTLTILLGVSGVMLYQLNHAARRRPRADPVLAQLRRPEQSRREPQAPSRPDALQPGSREGGAHVRHVLRQGRRAVVEHHGKRQLGHRSVVRGQGALDLREDARVQGAGGEDSLTYMKLSVCSADSAAAS